MYTTCESCSTWVEALGRCENGVWTRLDLLDPLEAPGLPSTWMALRGEDRLNTLAELRRELPEGHVLHCRKLVPVARHRGSDDVLIRTDAEDGRLWVVHLTWRRETDPQWPSARSFRDVAEFAQVEES